MKTWLTKYKWNCISFSLMSIFFFFSFTENTFNSASPIFFENFQKDSEALVVGKIVADQFRISTGNAKLNFLGTIDLSYGPKIYESYQFVENTELADLKINIVDLSDDLYEKGIAKKNPGFAVRSPEGKNLSSYLGRRISLDQERVITDIKNQGHLTLITVSGNQISTNIKDRTVLFSGAKVLATDLQVLPYLSQYGLQGQIFSKLFKMGLTLDSLWKLNSLLFALTLATIVLLVAKIFSQSLAFCFFLSFFFSPWITVFGKNLYWIPFSWFLPAIFSFTYFLSKEIRWKVFSLIGILLAFIFKCLSGYEYITSIILFAATPFIYQFMLALLSRTDWKKSFKQVVLIGLVGVIGFSIAIVIHARKRADTIQIGLQSIYEHDVKRRTLGGDANKFDSVYAESINATPFVVIEKYITTFNTPLLGPIPGSYFQYLLGLVLIIMLKFRRKDEVALFVTFIAPPLSWYILGKSHSYIHTNINYVLWYFGFVAVMLLILFSFSRAFIQKYLL